MNDQPDRQKFTGTGDMLLGQALSRLGALADKALERSVRIGITGLRRSGKTVFATSVVDNLLKGGRLPFLDVMAQGRFHAARLRSKPDAAVARFPYERYIAQITSSPPEWPETTRGVSQMRVAVRYAPLSPFRRSLQTLSTVNIDLVDYPGEWLMDLPLLNQSYADWSSLTLDLLRTMPRFTLGAAWFAWLERTRPGGPASEPLAREGASLYTDYLHACRRSDANLSLVQPGRFLEPEGYEDTPLLQFCPLPVPVRLPPEGSLWQMMEQRFEDYKRTVVYGFFSEHFARLDRQVVLVDVQGMLNAGPGALYDMRMALTAALEAFRHGQSNWFTRLFGSRIDRVLFAATKADHLAASQHENLRGLLEKLIAEARNAIRFEGARVETMAIASVKSTETVMTDHNGRKLPCVQGVPLGRDKPTVLFPGTIPEGTDLFPEGTEHPYRFLDFAPPSALGRDGKGFPNIRLDQALNYLVGDYLE